MAVMQSMVRKQYTDWIHGQLHSRGVFPKQAEKPTIVCLHMSPKSGRTYHQVLPLLANNRIAIAPDYPGMGESSPPPADPHVTISDYADAVWQVVDELAPGPVHFLGYHTGCMVAAEAASKRPEQSLSIASLSAPVFTDEETAELHETYAPLLLDESGSRFQIMWQRILRHRGPGMTLEMAATSLAENLRGGEDYEWGHRAAFNYVPTYRQRLAELDLPVFVLNPKDDCWTHTPRADALLKNGRRQDFPEWGHGLLDAHTTDFASVVMPFFEEHDHD
ncbi:MAG: alpha/beta fold hydrolase [Woeseiaceae bacterium]